MIPISTALKAHLAGPYHTLATCWKVTRRDTSVLAFTDHDADLTVDGVTYAAASGYTRSAIAGADDLSVDNLEIDGMLRSPAITEDSLRAGDWDYAAFEIFVVNWADLTMGRMVLRVGHLGQVSLEERGAFKAELLGKGQAYSRTIGEVTSPSCRADLGDARCTLDLTPYTVTGTLTGVGGDNQTLYDTARTEPGPTGGVTIVAITKANPGMVTTSADHGLSEGAAVQIYGVVGMVEVNTTAIIHNPTSTTFEIDDTSDFPTYVSGGTVVPLGSDSGYFDYGVITFDSGANAGRAMEIRSYVPGQLFLQLPMPYQCAIGDDYTLHAGCDKSQSTCKNRFDNIVNFRGEPFLPGIDRIMKVGTQ